MHNPILFWSLDLEMEQPSNEIISVGIAYTYDHEHEDVDFESRSISVYETTEIQKINFLITPSNPISPFIQQLTGLKDEMYDWSKSRKQCFTEALSFISSIVNDQKYYREPIVWGQGDLHLLRQQSAICGDLMFQNLPKRFVDLKTLILQDKIFAGKPISARISLSTALAKANIKTQGKAHNSADDAANTLKLYCDFKNKKQALYKTITSLQDYI